MFGSICRSGTPTRATVRLLRWPGPGRKGSRADRCPAKSRQAAGIFAGRLAGSDRAGGDCSDRSDRRAFEKNPTRHMLTRHDSLLAQDHEKRATHKLIISRHASNRSALIVRAPASVRGGKSHSRGDPGAEVRRKQAAGMARRHERWRRSVQSGRGDRRLAASPGRQAELVTPAWLVRLRRRRPRSTGSVDARQSPLLGSQGYHFLTVQLLLRFWQIE